MVKKRLNRYCFCGGLRLSTSFMEVKMVKLRRFFSLCLSFVFLAFSFVCFPLSVYASVTYEGGCLLNYQDTYGKDRRVEYHIQVSDSSSPVYCYLVVTRYPDGTFRQHAMLLSESSFSRRLYGLNSSSHSDIYEYSANFAEGSSASVSTAVLSGRYYVDKVWVDSAKGNISSLGSFHVGGTLPVIYKTRNVHDEMFWLDDSFEPGAGGEISSSIVYDSSIPAPQNLRFKSESVGGFLGIGAKFEHELSWSNGLASPPLYARISAVASTQATADDVPFEDSTVSLLSAETTGGYPADTGVYRVGTDEIASKILPGTSLHKVLEYRIQFYRYVDDKLNVGPVATVHLKTNLFGKYDGYTVTTEYPKDPDNIGESGGSDDFYDKDWSSDGQNYQEYDKDGNLIGSGTSEDSGNPVERLLKSLKDIPKIISSTFKAIFDLMSGIGQLPTILSQLFSFLPPEIIIIVGLGITVAIALRIVGR